eukprot:2807116-Rhodomonas_salina.1
MHTRGTPVGIPRQGVDSVEVPGFEEMSTKDPYCLASLPVSRGTQQRRRKSTKSSKTYKNAFLRGSALFARTNPHPHSPICTVHGYPGRNSCQGTLCRWNRTGDATFLALVRSSVTSLVNGEA